MGKRVNAIDTTPLRACAGRAADVLVETAMVVGGTSTWLGVAAGSTDESDNAIYSTGQVTLYDGSAGIAMAAWSVACALGRDDLANVALGAARHALASRDASAAMGLFDGLAGIGLAAFEVGTRAGDRKLCAGGLDVLGQVAAAPPTEVDLIGGSAGIILALLRVAELTGAERWRTAARTHGEHLLATANRHPWGWGWPLAAFDGGELCGLAHGAAGIAWSMGALAAATGDARFLAAADGARRYERSWFQRLENNWPDLRVTTQAASGAALTCPAFWCHGATGIGISRLALFRLDPHPALIAEATSALQAATSAVSQELDDYPAAGLTLCHGLGGSLLLLAAAHHALGEASHLEAARWLAAQALDRLGPDPWTWPCGVPNGGFSAGLMTGLAGAMYVLSRVAESGEADPLAVLGDQGPA